MRLSFDSIDEVKDFVKGLKNTRGGKAGDDDGGSGTAGATGHAPSPLQPPQGGAAFNPGGAAFVPPAGGATQTGGGPFAAVVPAVAPEVQALVNRVIARIDSAIQGGQPAEPMLAWFRTQCGPEAAAATMDNIKQVFLPRAPMPTLENIAKLMNA